MKKGFSYQDVYERHYQAFINEMREKERQYLTDRKRQLDAINKLLEICQKEIDFQLDTSISFMDVLSRKLDSDNVQWRLEVERTIRAAVAQAGCYASTVEAIRPIMTVLNRGNDPLSVASWRSGDSGGSLPFGVPERNRVGDRPLMQKIVKSIKNEPKMLTDTTLQLHPSLYPVSFYQFLTADRDGADWQQIETYAADNLEAAILPISPESAQVLFSWAQFRGLVK
ncbi:MAG: hypothetical protein LBR50_04140 [Tannerella sp.]|jgi:hypothetical protein|nr:hypothetical protein [Tannerella sp.]